MIPSAAPQHPDSETLSPSVLNELLAARARSMKTGSSMIRRLAALASRVLAVAALAGVAGYLLLSVAQSGDGLAAAPSAAAAPLADAASTAGPLQPAAESPLELEQRAVTEYIAKRYRVSEQAVAGYVSLAYH